MAGNENLSVMTAFRSRTSPGLIRQQWDTLSRLPNGKELFSQSIGKIAPYSGTISARVLQLRSGYAKVEMEDQKTVRNHLNSIHAVALLNLAEMTSGLAMLYSAPDNTRSIITRISIDYLKKARGLITAECDCGSVEGGEKREHQFEVILRDQTDEVVAQARVHWLVDPAS
ncbi:MAG: DUF4442 domain-containing protein [Acidobacteriota bacterium]